MKINCRQCSYKINGVVLLATRAAYLFDEVVNGGSKMLVNEQVVALFAKTNNTLLMLYIPNATEVESHAHQSMFL